MPYFKRPVVRIGVVLALALAVANSAWAQYRVMQPTPVANRPSFTIPLRDNAGVLRAYMTFRPSGRYDSTITFADAEGLIVNELLAPGAGQTGVAGNRPLPPVTISPPSAGPRPSQSNLESGRSDTGADVRQLRTELRATQTELQRVTERVNALAARR